MAFDPDVRVGEIRIFAETKEPLVALVVGDCGLSGWRIVPVSPYRVPASGREVAVGGRVFQLWNACTAARSFAVRSWRADALAADEVGQVRRALAEDRAKPRAYGGYERRQLAAGGDFRAWSERFPAKVSLWRRTGGWALAACVVLGLGVAWLVRQDEAFVSDSGRIVTVRLARQEPVPELEDALPECAPEAECAELAAADVSVPFPAERKSSFEPQPKFHEVARREKMKAAPAVRGRVVRKDAVVAAKADAGRREKEVVALLEELKGSQRADGSWGASPLKDTALAVLALMAHGETSGSAAFGKTLLDGVRWLTAAKLDGEKTQDVQIAACALCGASFAVPNPNVRPAAERALAALGDRRSVEAGRDWSGILADLTRPAAPSDPTGRKVAEAVRPPADAVADACILVLKLLSK